MGNRAFSAVQQTGKKRIQNFETGSLGVGIALFGRDGLLVEY